MSGIFLSSQWDEIYAFFAAGDPPLILQLLALNTIFLIVMVLRRIRGAPALRPDTHMVVQGVLIFANFFIMFREHIEGLLHLSI